MYDASDDGQPNFFEDDYTKAFNFFDPMSGLHDVLARHNRSANIQTYVGPPRVSRATAYIAQAVDEDETVDDNPAPAFLAQHVADEKEIHNMRVRLIREAVLEEGYEV